MKNKKTIAHSLGLKQEEIAAVLKISRAQWSMFESGKRELPDHARLQLAQIQNFMATVKAETSPNKEDKVLETAELEKLLTENQYQQGKASRHLAAAERKLEYGANALQLINYLASQSEIKKKSPGFPKFIEERAKKEIEKNGITLITRLKIKLQLLQYEENLIKAALDNL